MALTTVLLAAEALTGCGRPAGDPEPEMRTIDCAIGSATAFAAQCRVETRGDMLIVYQPDGGFRRLRKVVDGRGVVSADGAEPAHVAWIDDGRLEVTIGPDRYRFPAKLKADS